MKLVGMLLMVVVGTLLSSSNAANILGVFPIPGRSHWVVYESLMKALVARGHNVTVITAFPQKSPLVNYTEIDVSKSFPSVVNAFSVDQVREQLNGVIAVRRFAADISLNLCRVSHKLPQVRALLNSGIEFDAVSEMYF